MALEDEAREEVMTVEMTHSDEPSRCETIYRDTVFESEAYALSIGSMSRATKINIDYPEVDVMQILDRVTALQEAKWTMHTLPGLLEKLDRLRASAVFRSRTLDKVVLYNLNYHWTSTYRSTPRTLRECLEALRSFLIRRWLELRIFIVITRRETADSDGSAANPLAVEKTKPKRSLPRPTPPLALPERNVSRLNSQLLL